MLRCVAVDDEPLALLQIKNYVKQLSNVELVAACSSAAEARRALAVNDVDAVFVDINMPDEDGLSFVQSLPVKPVVVFTTAYDQYALEGFKAGAIDYLLKPFDMDEFKRVTDKVSKQVALMRQAADSADDLSRDLFVKTDYKIVRVSMGMIRYIEAMSEYLKIYTDEHKRALTVLMSMKKMEERLQPFGFMRIHRSYIINLNKIAEVSKNHVELQGDSSVTLPIGDLYKDVFMAYVNSRFLIK